MTENSTIELIKKRYSCRTYTGEPLSGKDKKALEDILSASHTGPFGGKPEFMLAAAKPGDSESLKGLGTYGFIKKPAGFIIGIIRESPMFLEDFGYSMEKVILHATGLGLGTCWLGGTFNRSRFAEKANSSSDTQIPAVAATGYIADRKSITEKLVRAGAGSDKRKSASELFFSHELKEPGKAIYDSPYGKALEMVRIGPSASNKQPWRILCGQTGKDFHFYMERTEGYNRGMFSKADLQRIDMGIAMSHFELSAAELGCKGSWGTIAPSGIATPPSWEYRASWAGR